MSKDMNQKVQTRYLQNGAYARLKNIQLGYTFPTQIINKTTYAEITCICQCRECIDYHQST